MAGAPQYTILGSGRWAGVLSDVLSRMERRATQMLSIRILAGEDDDSYRSRLGHEFARAADTVWIAVPPGPHSVLMVEAALDVGRHVIVEKPWPGSEDDSSRLEARARSLGLGCAVHYQYPFLDAVQALRERIGDGAGHVFSGRFNISRASRNDIPAALNLGSHLVAIWRVAFPGSILGDLVVGYERDDSRLIRLDGSRASKVVDFTHNAEPIIQRFIAAFESGNPGLIGPEIASQIGEIVKCI
jgi:Oxidoreductase family, NAD-binding Rossmann fold